MVSTKDTVSSLPGGKKCSAAMTGESPVREVDSLVGRAAASAPKTGRLCMHEKFMHSLKRAGPWVALVLSFTREPVVRERELALTLQRAPVLALTPSP